MGPYVFNPDGLLPAPGLQKSVVLLSSQFNVSEFKGFQNPTRAPATNPCVVIK
jgi:hypothetical protein